jgi:hypothetical protein
MASFAGQPWSWDLMSQVMGPALWVCRRILWHSVYLSSESIRRPSISKRQARTGGKLGRLDRVLTGLAHLLCTWFRHCELVRCFFLVSKEEDAVAGCVILKVRTTSHPHNPLRRQGNYHGRDSERNQA